MPKHVNLNLPKRNLKYPAKMTEEQQFKLWLDQQRRSLDLVLDLDGQWFHNGEPFRNEKLIRAFNRGIRVDSQTGEATVSIGHTWCYFRCSATPFLVVRTLARENLVSGFLLNTEETVQCVDISINAERDPWLLALTDGRTARFTRAAQAATLPFIIQNRTRLYLETDSGSVSLNTN